MGEEWDQGITYNIHTGIAAQGMPLLTKFKARMGLEGAEESCQPHLIIVRLFLFHLFTRAR